MKVLKEVLKSIFVSVALSFIIFVIVGIVFDILNGGTFTLKGYGFTKMAFACVLTGLGFGVPTLLYNSERISWPLASVIHLGIGFTIYFVAASFVGWIPVERGVTACIITIAGVIVIGVVIWLCFMRYYRNLADKMNQALEKHKS